jgi:hypothetical protein
VILPLLCENEASVYPYSVNSRVMVLNVLVKDKFALAKMPPFF